MRCLKAEQCPPERRDSITAACSCCRIWSPLSISIAEEGAVLMPPAARRYNSHASAAFSPAERAFSSTSKLLMFGGGVAVAAGDGGADVELRGAAAGDGPAVLARWRGDALPSLFGGPRLPLGWGLTAALPTAGVAVPRLREDTPLPLLSGRPSKDGTAGEATPPPVDWAATALPSPRVLSL